MSTTKQAFKLSDTDREFLIRKVSGGAAIGTAAALTTATLNHLNQLRRERERQKTLDDDVLTVKVRRPPQTVSKYAQEKSAMVTGGVGLAGGTLAMLGSYAAVHKMYQEAKRKRLQKMLDEAQMSYADVQSLETRAVKQASTDGRRPMGPVDFATSAPIAATILLALGGAGLTNQWLNKTFPAAKPARSAKPRRVVLKYVDDDEDQEKTASFNEDSGFELVVRTVLAGMEKSAESDLRNIVTACAEGRAEEISDNMELSVETGLDLVKGASAGLSPEDELLGTMIALRHPVLGPTVKTLAAAEFAEMSPSMFKMASMMDEDLRDYAAAIACTAGEITRAESVEKSASIIDQADPEILRQLMEYLQAGGETQEAQEDLDDLNVGGVDTNSLEEEGDTETPSDDPVDSLLSGGPPEEETEETLEPPQV